MFTGRLMLIRFPRHWRTSLIGDLNERGVDKIIEKLGSLIGSPSSRTRTKPEGESSNRSTARADHKMWKPSPALDSRAPDCLVIN
jgi:hypothetical protein